MASTVADNSSGTNALLQRATQGDKQALSQLIERHRDRLQRMVRMRLDRRLQGRVDPLDELKFEAPDPGLSEFGCVFAASVNPKPKAPAFWVTRPDLQLVRLQPSSPLAEQGKFPTNHHLIIRCLP